MGPVGVTIPLQEISISDVLLIWGRIQVWAHLKLRHSLPETLVRCPFSPTVPLLRGGSALGALHLSLAEGRSTSFSGCENHQIKHPPCVHAFWSCLFQPTTCRVWPHVWPHRLLLRGKITAPPLSNDPDPPSPQNGF